MSALITPCLPLLAGAPDGIQKLRGLILDLATQGRLIQKGSDWRQTKLRELVTSSGAGWSPSCENRPRAGSEWGVLKVSAVSWAQFKPDENKALPAHLEPRPDMEVKPGDFLISRANTAELVARSVVVANTPPHLILSDKIVRLRLSEACDPRFIQLVNSAPEARRYYAKVAGGTSSSMKNVSREQILALPVLLPPLEEQHRIVAKVDELMALCDRLEARQQDAEAAHARLVQALLDSLTQARDAQEFQAGWERLAGEFDSVFFTEASVDALRASVIELGILGRLGTGCVNDESAAELLKRLGTHAYSGNNAPLPPNWLWTKFSAICSIRSALVRPEENLDAPQVAPDCIEKGTGRLLLKRTVRESGVRGPNSRFNAGQIIYSKIRPSLSKVVLVDFSGLCSADMYPIDSKINAEYQLFLMLRALLHKASGRALVD
ncbi:restriction endonuclease subunit S [Sphaerotilus natans]|uniref:restriction endonuclease subunit S n=1 Tax=Sphaerotilus natans TaxID=34103 RepID=UPI00406D3B71